MQDSIVVLGISCRILRKEIKNIHLSVYPPDGQVSVSIPIDMEERVLRLFLTSKVPWIKKQQRKFALQPRESQRDFVDRETHYLWGQRYLLEIEEKEEPPSIVIGHSVLHLTVRPNTNREKRREIFELWYREQLRLKAIPLVKKWEQILQVKVERVYVQRMRTKWGSCTPNRGFVRLNTELAKKDLQCLEYIIVHEMVHLKEPSHNKVFKSLMDFHLPNWILQKRILDSEPLGHLDWKN